MLTTLRPWIALRNKTGFAILFIFVFAACNANERRCDHSFSENIPNSAYDYINRDSLRRRCRTAVRKIYEAFGQGSQFSLGNPGARNLTLEQESALVGYANHCLTSVDDVDDTVGRVATEIADRIVLFREKATNIIKCTGFLENESTVVTARHCFAQQGPGIQTKLLRTPDGVFCKLAKLANIEEFEIITVSADHKMVTLRNASYRVANDGLYVDHPFSICLLHKNAKSEFLAASSDRIRIAVDSTPIESISYNESLENIEQYILVAYSQAMYAASKVRNPNVKEAVHYRKSLYFDSSLLCRPHYEESGVFNHTCQTLEMGSGSPILSLSGITFDGNGAIRPRKYSIYGLNLGAAPFEELCGSDDNEIFRRSGLGNNTGARIFQ